MAHRTAAGNLTHNHNMLTPISPIMIFLVALIFLTNDATSRPSSSTPPSNFHPQPRRSTSPSYPPHAHLHMAFVLLVPSSCASATHVPSCACVLCSCSCSCSCLCSRALVLSCSCAHSCACAAASARCVLVCSLVCLLVCSCSCVFARVLVCAPSRLSRPVRPVCPSPLIVPAVAWHRH